MVSNESLSSEAEGASAFELCLFKSGIHQRSMLWDSCINMSWPFKLSPHITNLNLNEPPLQIHQQAMTLPPLFLSPNPLLNSTTPSDTYTPAGNNFTPSLKAPPPSTYAPRTHMHLYPLFSATPPAAQCSFD